MKASSFPCIPKAPRDYITLSFPFLFPTLSPSGKGRTFQGLPRLPLPTYGRSRRPREEPERPAWSRGPSGKTRVHSEVEGAFDSSASPTRGALCRPTWGSGCSGGGRRRQPRRRRPRLERRLKKERNRRGVWPLVVGGLPPFGAA